MLINQPYINKAGAIDNYSMLTEAGLLTHDSVGNPHDVTTWVGEAGMFDMSNPRTREWLWNRLSGLTAEGVSGWWGDLGEPEVHPLTIVHANGETAAEYHNVYGNEWSRTIYDGLRRDFSLDAATAADARRHRGTAALIRCSHGQPTWHAPGEGLQAQVPAMLNSGLSDWAT